MQSSIFTYLRKINKADKQDDVHNSCNKKNVSNIVYPIDNLCLNVEIFIKKIIFHNSVYIIAFHSFM